MQRGEVDMCIVGTDRTLANGDVCNKIGTYLKALAAHDNKILEKFQSRREIQKNYHMLKE